MGASIEKFPRMIELLKEEDYSPNKLSQLLNSDLRTTNKMISAGEKLYIITCKSMRISGRLYRVCSLSPEFRKMLMEKENVSET